MKRDLLWHRLHQTPVYDLVVVGGGATGLGVALDAALRGFSVALLESHDFGGGTSSRSTKLLHGGVRYLAQGNLPLIREALAERQTVLRSAPHLAQPLGFVMPAYRWWQMPFYGTGLRVYEWLAGGASLGATRWLSRQQTLALADGVQTAGLRGGVLYWDGQFDDARLALTLARSVERAGAVPLNHAEVTQLRPLSANDGPDGARFELLVQDRIDSQTTTVRARAVVNATGVWVDRLRQQAAGQAQLPAPAPLVSPSQGVHIVVDRSFLPGEHALLVPHTADGRVLFAIPWLGAVILGTTDTPRTDMPREPAPMAGEIDLILTEAQRVLQRPVQRSDIRSVWVGLRPLVAPPNDTSKSTGGAATARLSREHTIVTDSHRLVSVTGGKWTTYRAMAQDVLEACFNAGLLPRRAGATQEHALVGAPPTDAVGVPLHHAPGSHLYGTQWSAVLACPGADRPLGLGLTEAMVRFAARSEYAMTVEDVLARRWRALFLDARQAQAMAPQVAAILQAETGHDPGLAAFLALAQAYLPRTEPATITARR